MTSMEVILNPFCFGNLICGVIFIIVGLYMKKQPPKEINWLYGYRTTSSMKSQERWDFAQVYAAKRMVHLGLLQLILALAIIPFALFWVISIPIYLILYVVVQLALVVLFIADVQKAIRKKFDEN